MATIEKGKVFKAAEVIDYTNGGVVSKEFIHSNAGTVTLFSFDAGQGLSEHTAPFDALIQVIEGVMQLNVEGQVFNIKAGETFIIPSGAHHSVKAEERFKRMMMGGTAFCLAFCIDRRRDIKFSRYKLKGF